MEQPRYLQILSAHWVLATLGVLVALVAGFFASFTIEDGTVVSRGSVQYAATSRILLSSNSQQIFSSVETGAESTQDEASTPVNLPRRAVLYSYILTSDVIRKDVAAKVGDFSTLKSEDITAVARTTPPTGNERFPGRLELPIIDVVGLSTDEDRATELSEAAVSSFLAYVKSEQEQAKTPKDERVTVQKIRQEEPEATAASNPAIPAVVTFLGVLFAFAALIFSYGGIRSHRSRRRQRRAEAAREHADPGPVDPNPMKAKEHDAPTTSEHPDSAELVPAGAVGPGEAGAPQGLAADGRSDSVSGSKAWRKTGRRRRAD